MFIKTNRFAAFLILAVVLVISGCGSNGASNGSASPEPSAPASSAAGTAEASSPPKSSEEPVTIRFGYSPWIGMAGPIVANAEQLFAAKGVNVEFVEMEGNTKDAFMSGKLDAVVQSFDAVVQMKAKEKADDPVQIISVMDRSLGADGIIANEQIASLEQLKGKSVAVSIGSVAHFLLLKGLETVGLEESDVQIMNMNNNLAGSTFMAGQVDAAVTWEPYLSEATAKGGRVLYSTKDAPNLIVDAVVVKKSLIDNYPEQVRKMVEAFDEGLAMFNEGDEGKQIVADELGMDVPSLVSTVETLELTTAEGSEKMLVDDRAAWEETMKEYADFFVSQKILTETVDTTGIINDFLYK